MASASRSSPTPPAPPAPAHAAGLNRLRDAGITLLSTKGLYYEWLRTVECANRCRAECTGALGVPANW